MLVECRILVGPWVPTLEFAERLRQQRELEVTPEEDEVEFIQPKLPGRYTLAVPKHEGD